MTQQRSPITQPQAMQNRARLQTPATAAPDRRAPAAERSGGRLRRAILPPRPRRRHFSPQLGSAVLALLLVIAAGSATVLIRGFVSQAAESPPRESTQPSALPTVDPRLVLHPRSESQVAQSGSLRLALTAGPLIPGANRLTLMVADHGKAVDGAEIRFVVRMLDMRMTTRSYSATKPTRLTGSYAATASLPMFGRYLITVLIDIPGKPPVTHAFKVNLNL
jgi:hypothetical protein